MGEWGAGEEDLARECSLRGAAQEDLQSHTSQHLLLIGPAPAGALVVRGQLSPLGVDALPSLAAILIDRYQSFEKEERAETARKSEQLRADVLDALAHEFKTPLTAVNTASSGLLELGGLSDAQTDLVTLIDDEAVHLNELCTRLLQTARLDPEKVDLETDEMNVQELVSEVLATHPVGRGGNGVQVAMEDPALTVRADRGLLSMILRQYIDNAEKYSTPGTLIEIAARKSHTDVLISVHNFGTTIRIEDRERIFERFYRSPELKDDVPGTGIGLSVVRKAAEAHYGHVWVISDDKEGTTFFLPFRVEQGGTVKADASNARLGTILVVDDDSSTRRALRMTLSGMGFTVVDVARGEEALSLVRVTWFDAVLLDVDMPGMGGVEACRSIRRAVARLPILMLTVMDSEDDKVLALDAGADDYITKPFQLRDLTARLRSAVRRRNVQDVNATRRFAMDRLNWTR